MFFWTSHVCSDLFICAGFGANGAGHENAQAESSYSEIFVDYLFEVRRCKVSGGSGIGGS